MSNDLRAYPPLVREFAAYKLSIQGCSPKTVEEYLIDLRTFCRYLVLKRRGEETAPEAMEQANISGLDLSFFGSVTTLDIYEFLYYAGSERENENSAKSRKLSAIKMFYKYLTVKRGILETNPAANIESPKTKRQLPKYLSVEESVALLTAVQNDTDSGTRERDYAILTLFLNCGMRLSELVGISFGDMDPALRSLRVLGKGAKERVIYLNDACRSALEAYLPQRQTQKANAGHEQALVLSGQGRRISQKTVQWMVQKYLGAAGLGDGGRKKSACRRVDPAGGKEAVRCAGRRGRRRRISAFRAPCPRIGTPRCLPVRQTARRVCIWIEYAARPEIHKGADGGGIGRRFFQLNMPHEAVSAGGRNTPRGFAYRIAPSGTVSVASCTFPPEKCSCFAACAQMISACSSLPASFQ